MAMMSRITLHLKKQMHGGNSHALFLSSSQHTPSIPLSTQGADGLNITVQQVSIVHDDHGDVIDIPKPSNPAVPLGQVLTHSRRFEWHELRPISLNISGSRRSSLSSQQQRYQRLQD